ncbi:MAG: hypothetical protein ABEH43_03475, partial [Flavobacteriales bacterium]
MGIFSNRDTEKVNAPLQNKQKEDYYNKFNKRQKKLTPKGAFLQNFEMTKDPKLGYPPTKRLRKVYKKVEKYKKRNSSKLPGDNLHPWKERGPNNVGGRTRAIMVDPNDPSNKKVWAGGVTGGLWYTNDITDSLVPWNSVNDFWDNITITSIAYDPNNTDVFYVGTGESFYASSGRGAGVWKTTDGGDNWSQLSSTSNFFYVNDLVVRNESGNSVLYVAVGGAIYQGGSHGMNSQGLYRSTDGGNTFNQVLPDIPATSETHTPVDIELAADNRIWVGTKDNYLTFKGGGYILNSDDGLSWSTDNFPTSGRVEIATAPSDANYIYGLFEDSNKVDTLLYTDDKGGTWQSMSMPDDDDSGIPSDDFSREQAYYDL